MEVNQERAKSVKYSWCWFAKLITSFLDKIPALEASRGAPGNFSSTHGPAWPCPVPVLAAAPSGISRLLNHLPFHALGTRQDEVF